MRNDTIFQLKKTLDEYIESPLTNSQVEGLRKNKMLWGKAAIRLNFTVSFFLSLSLLALIGSISPSGTLTTLNIQGIVMVVTAALGCTIIACLALFPITTWLSFKRYRFELSIGEMEFHTPAHHDEHDFEFVRIDAAKIAHHEKAVCFLESIESMNRLPVGFEYRLLKDMITL